MLHPKWLRSSLTILPRLTQKQCELQNLNTHTIPPHLRWELRQICSHKVFGNQWAEKVQGSAPLVWVSAKQHSVGKMAQPNYHAPCSCIHPTVERVWVFFSGDVCISVTAALLQYAEEAQVDRSHPELHILSGSWEMPEDFLTLGQLSI